MSIERKGGFLVSQALDGERSLGIESAQLSACAAEETT